MRDALARTILIALVFVSAVGCTKPVAQEYPSVTGHRVNGTSVVAVSHGGLSYRVAAYELVFSPSAAVTGQVRRAALLVDLAGGQGHVRGFVEWDDAGDAPQTYIVEGWARQRTVQGEPVTVFNLGLNHLNVGDTRRVASGYTPALAVRVVVNETTGGVTLTRRQ